MNKQKKMMVARMVMAITGMILAWSGINELGEETIWSLVIPGFILCIPMYSFGIISIHNMCKGIEKDEKEIEKLKEEIKKIDAELERLSK